MKMFDRLWNPPRWLASAPGFYTISYAGKTTRPIPHYDPKGVYLYRSLELLNESN